MLNVDRLRGPNVGRELLIPHDFRLEDHLEFYHRFEALFLATPVLRVYKFVVEGVAKPSGVLMRFVKALELAEPLPKKRPQAQDDEVSATEDSMEELLQSDPGTSESSGVSVDTDVESEGTACSNSEAHTSDCGDGHADVDMEGSDGAPLLPKKQRQPLWGNAYFTSLVTLM